MKKNIIRLILFSLLLTNFAQASLLQKIDKGLGEYRKKNYKTALTYFIDYTNSNPNDDDGFFWLGKTYLALKDEKNAAKSFKKSYELTQKEKNITKINIVTSSNNDIEDYFDMALSYFESGDFKEADFYADMMLRLDANSGSAYFIKAKVAHTLNQDKEAVEYMKKAVLFNKELLQTNLAKELYVMKIPEGTKEVYNALGSAAYFQGDIDLAIINFKKSLELDSNNIDVLNALCNLYIKNNSLDAAQDIVNSMLKINPNNIYAFLNQAEIFELKKYDSKVLETLLKAQKSNPNNREALLRIANYYLDKKDYNNSLKYFKTLIDIDDTFYEGYFGYIYSLLELGKIDEAQATIRKIVSLNPNNGETYYLLARLCIIQGEFGEALNYLKEAVRKENNPLYFLEMAKINYDLKDYLTSLDNLKNAPKCDETIIYYNRNYIKLNNFVDVVKNLLDKNGIMYKYNLYEIHKLKGNDKQAKSQLKKIYASKPVNLKDYIDLSEIYFEESNLNNSIKTLDSAIKKFPNSKEPYFQKIRIYSLTQNRDKLNETIQILKSQE